MQEVMAIVRPEKTGEVKRMLIASGQPGYTCRRVTGRGKNHDALGVPIPLVPKRMFLIMVPDTAVPEIVSGLMDVCSEGNHGDGKVYVMPVERSYHIHGGEGADTEEEG